MTNPHNATFVFVTGPPASGKTTLSRALSEQLDCYHLDVDAYFYDLATNPNNLPAAYCGASPWEADQLRELRHTHGHGIFLSILILKIHQETQRLQAAGKRPRFILDGFPATQQEADAFEHFSGGPRAILALGCGSKTHRARLLNTYGRHSIRGRNRLNLFHYITRDYIADVETDPRFVYIDTANSLEYCKQRALQAVGQAWVEDLEGEGEPADAA